MTPPKLTLTEEDVEQEKGRNQKKPRSNKPGWRRQCEDPEDSGGAGVTEDQGGAKGKGEPDRAIGTERRGEAGGVESSSDGRLTTEQGRTRGMTVHSGDVGAWSQGGVRAQRLEVETGSLR